MRAVVCTELGTPDLLAIGDLPATDPGPTEVVVDVEAASFNFPDLLIIQGQYQFRAEPPFAPGGEAVGRVSAVGDKVSGFAIGDRVTGFGAYGAFADQWTVDQGALAAVPDGVSVETVAASTMTYGTSYHALVDRADIQPGETLLVLGASGGVGSAAIEIGKALGATVVAAASTQAKLDFCTDLGADHVINYVEEDLKSGIRDRVGSVDVIYDPVGGPASEAAFRTIGWGGRHLVVGFTSGDIPKLPLNLPLLKGAAALGVFWGAFAMRDSAGFRRNAALIFDMISEGTLNPRIMEVVAFDDFHRGFELIGSRSVMGKVVLDVGQPS